MNKNDLIASVASSAGLSKSDATRAIESFLDSITNSLKRDEKVSIVGFGNFSVSHRKATDKILEDKNLDDFVNFDSWPVAKKVEAYRIMSHVPPERLIGKLNDIPGIALVNIIKKK